MKLTRLLVLAITIFAVFKAKGQTLRFADASTLQPIEGVFVVIIELKGKRVVSYISDKNGIVSLKALVLPIVISGQHLSYDYWTDTLTTVTNQDIWLKASNTDLGQVVVTGQFRPQQLDQSVFSIRVIDQVEIKRRNAVSLAEVLSNSLNIRLSEDLTIGSTSVSLLGTSGQNAKILLDGVPLVNRNGNGNAADLSQINLNQIERIEVVEGPMAVSYGANALAGVINLISKKKI